MTEEDSGACRVVCRIIDAKSDTGPKRFDKYFCSSEHMIQYVKAKQRELCLCGDEQRERRRSKSRFGRSGNRVMMNTKKMPEA
jgi:hypothetical protein